MKLLLRMLLEFFLLYYPFIFCFGPFAYLVIASRAAQFCTQAVAPGILIRRRITKYSSLALVLVGVFEAVCCVEVSINSTVIEVARANQPPYFRLYVWFAALILPSQCVYLILVIVRLWAYRLLCKYMISLFSFTQLPTLYTHLQCPLSVSIY